MDMKKDMKLGNPAVVAIIVGLVVVFFIMAIIPQSFWVDLSIKLFKQG